MITSKPPTMKPGVSRHAQARMQQRGIARSAVDCLLDYGREHHDHHGAVIVMLDRASMRRLARVGAVRAGELDAMRRLYAVVTNDGCICTVGHRSRRLRRA
jgi:hypothetical protein